ncbi:MogA/MoaB family molybdenum cofactor biosynthesis protein [Actinocorallia longicatena]|uniref:MogA/MoaB family molybdenum cofactor biosynthesis protein n=1 Tax=Actinocorallia longicatena TaxID=111803 RepID=A0ABP6Q5P4_9ACTN
MYEDRSGPVLAELLREYGCAVDGPRIVPDGPAVLAVLKEAVEAGYDVVVTSGGTGINPTDQTPEMTREILDKEIPGISDAIRRTGPATSILSRGLAGVAAKTLIVNLPGSTGGVRDGMGVLGPVLAHAVSQIGGGDHRRDSDGA